VLLEVGAGSGVLVVGAVGVGAGAVGVVVVLFLTVMLTLPSPIAPFLSVATARRLCTPSANLRVSRLQVSNGASDSVLRSVEPRYH
jgi:hypothetical protein